MLVYPGQMVVSIQGDITFQSSPFSNILLHTCGVIMWCRRIWYMVYGILRRYSIDGHLYEADTNLYTT